MKKENRNNRRLVRSKRVGMKIVGTDVKPRISVFRSLRSFSVQIIDDVKGVTILSACTLGLKEENNLKGVEKLGSFLASKCLDKKIEEAVFDRSGYKYHGKIKVFADSLRLGGLKF